jgi:hypothetical protein
LSQTKAINQYIDESGFEQQKDTVWQVLPLNSAVCARPCGNMSGLSTTVKLALVGGAVAFVGLCVFLDSKRRSAPDYRETVVQSGCCQGTWFFFRCFFSFSHATHVGCAERLEKKKQQQQQQQRQKAGAASSFDYQGDPQDSEALKEYFMQQMTLGQNMLESSEWPLACMCMCGGCGRANTCRCVVGLDPREAVAHFACAVKVYGEPAALLQILQQRLPAELFMLLIQELNIDI